MKYPNITKAVFIKRPNRFIAEVDLGNSKETVHVKNTGRCKELLLPGAEVWLTALGSSGRKTKYDLIAVRKSTGALFNIDSQAPNKVMAERLNSQGYDKIIPEYRYGSSRIDFYMERGEDKYLLEVKGCTLEINGVGYFPDAPTERGIKHIKELINAKTEGYHAAIGFVIQVDGVNEVRANIKTHREFGEALNEAKRAGVRILFFPCHVCPESLVITNEIEER